MVNFRRHRDDFRSRERSRHRSRRSRSRSYPIDRNALMNWDYDDYVQEVSRGLRNPVYSAMTGGLPAVVDPNTYASTVSSRERDQRYEERVNAFLRGIDSRRDDRRSYSRSRSKSYSPSPRRYDHHEEWQPRAAYSRSRSPSFRRSGGNARREPEDDRSYRRSPDHYESPRHRGPSTRSRSPPFVADQTSDYWHRAPRSAAHSSSDSYRRCADERAPRRRDPSPRYASRNAGRPNLAAGRRHR